MRTRTGAAPFGFPDIIPLSPGPVVAALLSPSPFLHVPLGPSWLATSARSAAGGRTARATGTGISPCSTGSGRRSRR
jgi:hypothetical protein